MLPEIFAAKICIPVLPHGKHRFLQQNMFLFYGKSIFPCGKTGKHWGNVCPQQMSLATNFLASQGLNFGREGRRKKCLQES